MIANVSPLLADLGRREAEGRPITIGVVGAGQMGTDLAVQVGRIPGMRLGGIAVRNIDNAIAMAVSVGHRRDRISIARNAAAIDAAIERGALAITDDIDALTAAGRIDVMLDATGNPNTGTAIALSAIQNGKHMVMMNVEADITIGRYLHGLRQIDLVAHGGGP